MSSEPTPTEPAASDLPPATKDSHQSLKRSRNYLRTIRIIYARELRSFLCTPFGWVVLACTMGLQGFSLQTVLKVMSVATGEGIMYYMLNDITFWFYFIFLFPLITMRSFAEEERMGTLEGLLTAPVSTMQIVLGKYLACYTFYLCIWIPLLLYPWMSDIGNFYTLQRYGVVAEGALTYRLADWVGSFSILALVGTLFVALGVLCSSLTRSQIIAGIICTCMMITYYFLSRVTELWGEFQAAPLFHYVSMTEQISSFSRGLVDTRPVMLYLSATIFTLALTKRIVDYRRWRR